MTAISELLRNDGFRSVLLVVIGFALSQLNNYFAERGERKKAVSSALSDLLEVRHQFIGLEALMEQLGEVGHIPEHQKSQMRVVLDSLFPNWEELHARYEHSVNLIAGLDPLLGFQLRSKDFLRPILRWVHSLMGQDSQAAALMGPLLKSSFLSKVEPVLDRSILRLAWKKNPLCWYKTHRLLKRSKRIPDEIREMLEPMKAIAEAQIKAAASHPEVQNPSGAAT